MKSPTVHIYVMVTAVEKRRISKLAKDAGISPGEFIRRAALEHYPPYEVTVLEGMIDQMVKTTAQASHAIDHALAFVEASNKRIDEMERKAINDRFRS